MVKKESGDVLCGSPVSDGPHTHTQGAGGGRAVAGLPGAKRASNKIAAELKAREEQEEKAAISRQQAWAVKKCGKYLMSHKVADRYRKGEFCGRAEGSGLAAIEAVIQLYDKKELIGAGWRPKVWSEKLDGRNRLILQMFWKEATRPMWSMLIPPKGSNVQEWTRYRQYHVASSLDEPSGLFGPAKKRSTQRSGNSCRNWCTRKCWQQCGKGFR